jgi:sarcosine oxidase subunit alpha
VDLGAEFLEVGLWYRSRYFPKAGEDMAAASEREVLATRRSVGVCDVSTLGKIDIQGPDAGEFLNLLYSNGFKTLQVGKARYGLMLREDGILYDDGTASRLTTDRYLMTTTTHNAAGVLAHMEFYHQCVWPGLDVQFCSVTEQWAGLAVAGPRSRELLSRVLPQILLDNDAFPYMAAGEFIFQGMPLRLFRISFSGELGYEINVPAGYARAFADHLMEVGEAFGLTPYGSEALDVMRIEKGHVTAKELNGQTTPNDLGLGRMVSQKKDYIGRFLSGRPGMTDANRQRIVGLVPERAGARLFAGAHLVGLGKSAIAKNDEGFVTSVTYSPALGHWIGLALVNGGEERIGEKMRAIEGLRGMEADVELVSPLFLDPEGVRLRD